MLNTLLFIHLIIAILLIIVILLQKTSTDGLSGIGGGSAGNMGLMSGRSAANFMTKTTIILAVVFFANAIVLANLSTKSVSKISKKIEIEQEQQHEKTTVPVMK